MPKRTDALDRLNVASPCSASWEEMVGNDQVRFCQHCSLHVHDLSKITRKDALKLVSASKGKLCLRYYRRPDGLIQTAQGARPLTQIKRRLSRVAAGAFTATLSLASGAAAQSASATTGESPVLIRPYSADPAPRVGVEGQAGSVVGTVFDPQQAVIPMSKVLLINEATGLELSATSDEEGNYQFQPVGPGTYKLKVEAGGFQEYTKENVVIAGGGEQRVDATLGIEELMVQGGSIAISPDTPLISAIWGENMDEVRNLLASGVDLNVVDKSTNSTALAEAVSSGKLELVQTLLQAGADPNQRNNSGGTALMRLDEDSTAEMVRALVDAGAQVNLKDEDGESALHVAAAVEKVEILQAILDAGAKVNARNKEGKTALMIAAEEGYVENVRALLWAGADPHRKDKEGTTALKYARHNDHEEVVKLLNSYGAFN